MIMDRRSFLLLSSAGLLDFAVGSSLSTLKAKESGLNGKYSIVMLGDTHFDTEPASVYHSNYNEKVEWYDENLRDVYDQAFELAVHKEVRRGILEEGVRPDGRKLDEVRPLSSQVAILPRVHGSSLFTRGVTQAMNIVTLAPLSYAQDVDTMEVTNGKRRYMHHYNAPSYTVGEPGRIGSPGRREIGHGYLAERALLPVLPSEEEFPYAIRSV
ncbi:MAG: hypothetical protein IKB63_01960, partial [Parabacteroides sp.]|nr:hypothetical protein [Parabacteroides sp.]